jgi:uncharacterized protein
MENQKTELLVMQKNRIEVVDALRGFAIMSIMLLHNLEHFDFYFLPPQLPEWMKLLDARIFEIIGFLFAGKSYAIFALLFGFTFYLMDKKQQDNGKDFRLRFLWRLFLLFLFGMLNTVFYQGDILNMYALMGLAILPVCRFKDKTVLIIAAILLLQPLFIGQFIYGMMNPDLVPVEPAWYKYFYLSGLTQGGDSFWEMVKGNFTNGKLGVYLWSWDKGRFFQAPALFMLGMLIGRKGLFLDNDANRKFWRTVLNISIVVSVFFLLFMDDIRSIVKFDYARKYSGFILESWYNLSLMFVWVSGFILLFKKNFFHKILSKLVPFGRMSLTNYVMQSIFGAFIYYGFALGLYQYTGATYSLLIGILLFLLQITFCKWWLKSHKQGPLEFIWHKATWI